MSDLENREKERLGSYHDAVPIWLRTAITPLIPPQIVVEPGFSGSLLLSFFLHLVVFIFMIFPHHNVQHGAKEGENAPQVEMVFEPPTQKTSQPASMPDNGGGAVSPPPPQAENSGEKAVIPTPSTPNSENITQSDEGELAAIPPSQKPVISAKQRSEVKKKNSSHASHYAHAQENNPFAHPMDLSFNGPPTSYHPQRGRRRGAGGPIDMSLGPLSMNGQINAPYRTRSTVKGVSSDYGSEIDRWVRAHMFYPDDAAQNGEEGPSSVHVVIDRSGHVKSVRLTGQSGSYSLDAATSGMFQGAKLPPVPPDMSGDHFDLDVTINYILIRH